MDCASCGGQVNIHQTGGNGLATRMKRRGFEAASLDVSLSNPFRLGRHRDEVVRLVADRTASGGNPALDDGVVAGGLDFVPLDFRVATDYQIIEVARDTAQ